MDRSGISPIKILSLTLGVVVKVRSLHSTPKGKLCGLVAWASVVGGKGWGEMVQGAERGREATSPAMCPNEFIRTF